MNRAGAAFVGLLVIVGSSAGCPGELDPDPFLPCNPQHFLTVYCGTSRCHEPAADASPDQLDLVTPGVEGRLIGKPATYYAVPDNERLTCPSQAEILIDPNNPNGSLFIKKLQDRQTCGSKMPYSGRPLRPLQIECLTNWALGLAGAKPDSGAGGSTP
jgi:hypothetical protein